MEQKPKPKPKPITTKNPNNEFWKKPQSLSQTIHNRNIDCIGCYGHTDRSTSLSYLENVNNLNKAEVICRNLGMDKDLYSKVGQLIVYVADELADENF